MKKELLMASALVSTLGVASVAQAVSYTLAGSMKIGAEFESPGGAAVDTNNVVDLSNFNVSLSETTDEGTTLSTSFQILDEGVMETDDDNSLTLTFIGGTVVDLLNAGNSAGTHVVAVPGAGGEQGIGGTSSNNAPTDVDFGAGSTALGIEVHSPANFLADGLKLSASFSADSGAAKTATAALDSSYGIGATYVTELGAGDTTLTIGGGFSGSEVAKTGTQLTTDQEGFNIGVSAVTGALTVGVGFGDGDTFADEGGSVTSQVDGSVTRIGISYAAGGGITLAIGATTGEAKDSTTVGTAGTTDDSHDATSASVTYAVADGVSAVIGYTTVDQNDEGLNDESSGGSAWYIGATMSF